MSDKPVPKLKIELVEGVEGPSLYLNNYRIAGPKPWGGGRVSRSWLTDAATIKLALKNKP